MKVAEIGVMTAGFFALHAVTGRIEWLLAVVFLMGTHSAFFGPPKYGILPELFRERDLPQVNGMIQMTTFLSIILRHGARQLHQGMVQRPAVDRQRRCASGSRSPERSRRW